MPCCMTENISCGGCSCLNGDAHFELPAVWGLYDLPEKGAIFFMYIHAWNQFQSIPLRAKVIWAVFSQPEFTLNLNVYFVRWLGNLNLFNHALFKIMLDTHMCHNKILVSDTNELSKKSKHTCSFCLFSFSWADVVQTLKHGESCLHYRMVCKFFFWYPSKYFVPVSINMIQSSSPIGLWQYTLIC